jgi:hypothetical protein
MKAWTIVAAALLAGPAAAQDAPKPADPPAKEEAPARHVNKVTDAAKAALDKLASLLYSPLKGGLKDLSGAVKMEVEAAGGERAGAMGKLDLTFAVSFKAPADLKVEWKDAPVAGEGDEGKGAEMRISLTRRIAESMNLAVTRLLRSTVMGFVPAGDSEFDADLRVENGVSTLVITTYLKGAEVSREEITLDANGIPTLAVSTAKDGARPRGADGKSTVKFSYAKEGDLFRLEKMTMDGPRGPMEANLAYADAGNFKVVKSWEMAPAGGAMKFAFRFSEMIANGKPVDLGAKPEPKPEGKKE